MGGGKISRGFSGAREIISLFLKDPGFLNKDQILLYHHEQIGLFGGSDGLRDEGLLESAISAPQNVYCYEENADIFDLAVSYLHALAKARLT